MGGVGCLGSLLHHLGHPRLRHALRGPHLLGGLLYDRLGRSRGSLHGDEGGGLVGGDVVVVLRLRRRLRMLMWL